MADEGKSTTTAAVELDTGLNYLTFFNNSVGSQAYRNGFAWVDGEHKDILEDGEFSCAYFASNVLLFFGLINSPHMTVFGTMRDLENFGKVRKIDESELAPGDVLVWEALETERNSAHIGFYKGDEQAVSTSFGQKSVVEHDYLLRNKYPEGRKLTALYRPLFLDKSS